MSATPNAAVQTRIHWAGTAADLDIHVEAYEGDIDQGFRVESLFRSSGLTTYKSVKDRSNTWRGDRMGAVAVKGRGQGESLDAQRIPNSKYTVTVDQVAYVRTAVDYQDDWTAPDRQAEISQAHGTAHAKSFDTAHMIMLIKAGAWVAPAELKTNGAFNDGISATLTGYAAETDYEKKADIIVRQHKAFLAEFVKRDLGGSLGEFVTLMEPDLFSALLDHKKLMNVDFGGGALGDNSFVQRRVGILNGVRVIETPRFPTVAASDHPLGPAFNVSAAEAKARMIVFHPRMTLVTVEAQPMTLHLWDNPKDFETVLDSYQMYTVDIRRGDACAVAFAE